MKNTADIAIIMPAYNCSKTIERAINSILDQSFSNWHLYIINDCSTDNLEHVLFNYAGNIKITVINNNVNLGAAESRNIGLKACKEEYIAFLDSDDEWHTNKLKLQYECLNEGDDFLITNYNYIKPNGDARIINYRHKYFDKNSFLRKKFRVCFSSVCFKRCSVEFKKIGHEDFLFLNDLFNKYGKARVVQEPVVNYYSIEGSLSNNKKRAISWHLDCLRFIFKNNLVIGYYFYFYVLNAILFKWKLK